MSAPVLPDLSGHFGRYGGRFVPEALVRALDELDAAYRSAKSRSWEPVELYEWRGGATNRIAKTMESHEGQIIIKREVLPDGRTKLILKDPASGDFTDRIVAG